MAFLITLSRSAQYFLLSPSPVFGFPWMDVLGVPRLSIILDQVFREVNRGKGVKGSRPGFVKELMTILTLVLTGDILLHLLLPSTTPLPSFFSPPFTPVLLFGTVHLLITQTPLQRWIPDKAPFWWEALAAVNDGLGRALVVGMFVCDGLVKREGLWATGTEGQGAVKGGLGWWGVVMAAWVGVYGGGLLVNTFSMFSSRWSFSTPPELKPWGWLTQDFWIPPVAAHLYLLLTSPPTHLTPLIPSAPSLTSYSTPHSISPFHLLLAPLLPEKAIYLTTTPWSKEDARALLGVGITGLFVARAVWVYYGGEIKRAIGLGGVEKGEKVREKELSEKKTQ